MTDKLPDFDSVRKEILGKLNIFHKKSLIDQATHNYIGGRVTAGENAKRDYSLEGIINDGIIPPGRPVIPNQAAFDALPADEQDEFLQYAFAGRHGPAMTDATTLFASHGEKIFKDADGNYNTRLVEFALDESIQKYHTPKDLGLLNRYQNLKSARDLAKMIDESGDTSLINGQQAEALKSQIVNAAARKQNEDDKKKGYMEEDRRIRAHLVGMSVKNNPETLKAGIQENIRRAAEDLNKYAPDADQRLAGYVARSIEKMANSDDMKEQVQGMSYFQKTYTGKHFGEK